MTISSNLSKFGICDISPEISHQFLSLNDLSTPLVNESDEQKFLRSLLIHFDLLTSCNLRNFLRAKLFFEACQKESIKNQALSHLIDALTSWANLNYSSAKLSFNSYLDKYPCDVVVFFMLHMMDFCCGNTPDSLCLINKLDLKIFDDHHLYGYYLGIKSFVMCESNNFQESLEVGLKSLSIIEKNIYAIHAVVHAYHEIENYRKIIEFLNKNMPFWIDNQGMRMHVYWHIALAELGLSSIDNARTAFDTFYSMKTSARGGTRD